MISPYVFAALGMTLAVRIILGTLDDENEDERGEDDESKDTP